MTHARLLGALTLMASLCSTTLVHADVVADFSIGTTLYLRVGRAFLGDSGNTTGGIALAKPPNTLDFTIPASQIGLNLPISLHATPTTIQDNVIFYSISGVFTAPLDIDGNGDYLTSVSGTVVAVLTQVPGNQPTIGNVLLTITPGTSWITAVGTWGSQVIWVDGELVGGVLPSNLKSFYPSGDQPICSDTAPVKYPLKVVLAHPAPSLGQIVSLTSADQQQVNVPLQLTISPSQTLRIFDAVIAPNYVGTMRLTAAANGAVGTVDLQVQPHAYCAPSDGGSGPPVAYNPDPGCIECTIFQSINDLGEKLGIVNRAEKIIDGAHVIDLLSTVSSYGATAITATNLTTSGYVAGQVTIRGAVQGYRANYNDEPGVLHLLGALTPTAIGTYGTVVGSRIDPSSGRQQAAYESGHGVKPVTLPASFGAASSKALAITDAGEIVGTYTPATGGLAGFRATPTATTALPTVGIKPGVPVAVNASGQIAANGADAAGHSVAAIIGADNRRTLLGVPSGATSFTVKSLNKFGWAVGVATVAIPGAVVQRGYLWIPTRGFRALSGYTRDLTIVDDALQITDAGTVVLHGTNAGVTNLFVLAL